MKSKRTAWLTAIFCLLIVGTIATFFVLRRFNREWEAEALWQECRSELIAAGEPITLAEIEARRPTVPDKDNGSLVIECFAAELQDLNSNATESVPFFDKDLRHIDPFAGIPQASVEPMRTFLADNSRLVNELATLNANTNGRLTNISYDFKGDNPNEFKLPSLAPWSIAGQLMCLQSIGQLIEGDSAGAAESIVAQFGIAATMRHEPNYRTYTIRLRIIRNAISSLEAAIRTGKIEPHQLDRISAQISKRHETISPAEVMRAERTFLILAYESLAAKKIDVSDVFCDQDISDFGTISKFDIRVAQLRAVSYWPNRIEAAGDPEKLLNAREDKRFRRKSLSIDEKKRWLFTELLPHSYFSNLSAQTHARLRCAIIGIATERFRMDHNRSPKSLDELVPTYIDAIPNDPFTGNPLKLAETDLGVVIYSTGIDEEDNGGDLRIPTGNYSSPDIGFRLAKAARRGSIVEATQLPDDTK